jgi:putative ABC transport system permease protein
MSGRTDWRSLWRSLLSRRQMKADIEDEIAFHIEGKVDALMEEGLSEDEARERALLRFGNEARYKAEMAAASGTRIKRKQREITMDSLIRDLKYSLRQITRNPGFSALLVLTIAVAIGGNVAIFSVLEGIVLRPLPYPEADRLVAVWESPEGERSYQPFTGPDYLDVREQIQSLEEIGVVKAQWFNLSGSDEPLRIRGGLSSASLMDLLGVRPLHGRLYTEAEELEGNNRVVVLSQGLWENQFGGDPEAVGRQINMDGGPWEVIGVMPESFRFPTAWGGRDDTRLWAPLVVPHDPGARSWHSLGAIGRMAPGITPEEVEAELSIIALQLAEAYPNSNAKTRMWVQPMMTRTLGGISSTVVFLLIIVGLVLLIACANVASMLLARGMNRASEFAIRASMGAGTRGLVSQLLTESLVMALIGGGAGILLAFWGVDALKTILPESIPRTQLIEVNLKVLGFASVVTILTGLLVGLAPSLFAARTNLAETIKHGRASRGGTKSRFLSGMVAAQLAVGFVLVNSAIVLAVSYVNVMTQPTNFSTDDVVVTGISLAGPAYESPLQRRTFYHDLAQRVRNFPGVTYAGITSKLPLRGGSNAGVLVRDQVYDPQFHYSMVEHSFVGDGYFEAMGIGLLSGRTFDQRDMEMASVMAEDDSATVELPLVINRAMAEEMWPEVDALGQLVRPAGAAESYRGRVVGIVENVRQWGPERDPLPEMYFPHTAEVWGSFSAQLIVRAGVDTDALSASIRGAVDELDPTLPLAAPITMGRILEDSTAGRRFSMLLVGLFAATALLLIVAGTYGVVSYSVSQRTHEIGVRMTLGAGKSRVASLFLKRVGYLVGPGLALGALGSWSAAQITRSMVYGISPLNPIHMGLAAGVMLLVALAATAVPVFRATGVDPLEALRVD